MGVKRWSGGYIKATSPNPEQGFTSGIWTIDRATYWAKKGFWPPGQYLVVAGGGSGGSGCQGYAGGGGGAGGYQTGTNLPIVNGITYTVTIGAGGVSIANGTNSSITAEVVNINSIGGGRGGRGYVNTPYTLINGAYGGSGGGGSTNSCAGTTCGGASVTGQGFSGGKGYNRNGSCSSIAAGGGGGAGAVGGNAAAGSPGAGGAGLYSTISGANVAYAGGGGGGTFNVGGGAGGVGGGGAGRRSYFNGCAGTVNTGGGGGGGHCSGGTGGSGIVIIRTPKTAVNTTGSPTVTTQGLCNIYKFTGSGTIRF